MTLPFIVAYDLYYVQTFMAFLNISQVMENHRTGNGTAENNGKGVSKDDGKRGEHVTGKGNKKGGGSNSGRGGMGSGNSNGGGNGNFNNPNVGGNNGDKNRGNKKGPENPWDFGGGFMSDRGSQGQPGTMMNRQDSSSTSRYLHFIFSL